MAQTWATREYNVMTKQQQAMSQNWATREFNMTIKALNNNNNNNNNRAAKIFNVTSK